MVSCRSGFRADCGGNVLWQNPEIPLLSPVFPLSLVMSLPLAMKIQHRAALLDKGAVRILSCFPINL
ncbi:MAG: hypothetical protein QM736_15520, partial [Vicinamibacterales bacterium]